MIAEIISAIAYMPSLVVSLMCITAEYAKKFQKIQSIHKGKDNMKRRFQDISSANNWQ